ncbi:hypothetical protein [Acetobacterium woodii]|uniref:Radical SAM domain protein n=1 Tax=Acetobacterium woodii (strain ATCC 29683 / DSM 1030 / JCM 2381 / KCTC 1655 / WB1) TaxID=931626 RepID=H6LCC8_ACEWD|nr:hypothetical protein [Acetobacterium woodii]AFA50243.1 hypothetical protein Awo_c35190 [Acetobacterium woodii DSM 1030]
MKILRIFPKKTSYTPIDSLVYYPNGIIQSPSWKIFPEFDEIHISCSFTWDRKYCQEMAFQFRSTQDRPVKLGGPAFKSQIDGFTQGLYMKPNIIFTSRGCNNNCPWCIVPKIEGKLKEIPICQGNVIQDNNFLQTSRQHKDKVFRMLKTQKRIQFKGGLEVDLIDDHFVDNVRGLSIDELWLACDTDGAFKNFEKAAVKLVKAGFTREHIKCYALIDGDISENEERLQKIWWAGAMPFAQLYRDFTNEKTKYSKEVEKFARSWQRPAAINMHMKKGTDFRSFNI